EGARKVAARSDLNDRHGALRNQAPESRRCAGSRMTALGRLAISCCNAQAAKRPDQLVGPLVLARCDLLPIRLPRPRPRPRPRAWEDRDADPWRARLRSP